MIYTGAASYRARSGMLCATKGRSALPPMRQYAAFVSSQDLFNRQTCPHQMELCKRLASLFWSPVSRLDSHKAASTCDARMT